MNNSCFSQQSMIRIHIKTQHSELKVQIILVYVNHTLTIRFSFKSKLLASTVYVLRSPYS